MLRSGRMRQKGESAQQTANATPAESEDKKFREVMDKTQRWQIWEKELDVVWRWLFEAQDANRKFFEITASNWPDLKGVWRSDHSLWKAIRDHYTEHMDGVTTLEEKEGVLVVHLKTGMTKVDLLKPKQDH